MTTATATATAASPLWQQMGNGRPAFIRFAAYLGLAIGISAMALFRHNGYEDQLFLSQLLGREGAIWGGAGTLLGALLAFAASQAKPELSESSWAERFVGWCDGLLGMALIAAILALLEPAQSQISYDDQSNLVSGKVIMAMNMFFLMSAVLYIVHLFAPDSFIGKLATRAAWIGVFAGGSALLLRWHESYLISADIGHAPVSNLYEVFILLFCITSAIYLVFEHNYKLRGLGAFVMPLVAAGVFFGIWLDSKGLSDIKPLVPALQSYWMKIHVPMNFVGYGAFAVACGAGMMYLVRQWLERINPRAELLKSFPSLEQLDDLSYKSVAVGFPAFTLATILGAAWAAEAWGGYWSWDPKETWALIVWLVYGAYLHARFSHDLRGRTLAWWVVAGFLVTLFCFVGVNMYLSGLHSYGRLS